MRHPSRSMRRLVAAAVSAGAVLLASQAEAQGTYNTFTSGNPPVGDGNIYPFSLTPARLSLGGSGVSPGTFFSTDVAFNNLNGNPAFFDANNLLTRPAALITGEAFWTDPKIGNFNLGGNIFPISQMGFEIYDSFSSFGFDLAVGSASADVPDSLPFQIQTQDDFFASGELFLDAFGGGGDSDSITPFSSGTFATLGGARPGKEARYRIDVSTLEDMLNSQNGGGDPDDNCEDDCDFEGDGDIFLNGGIFFDIDLSGISTQGGTTQIAIDNFVLNGATLPTQTPDPTYLPPTPPVGPNRPQYFDYSADAAPDNPDGDEYDIDPTLFEADLSVISVDADTSDVDAQAYTEGVNVYFDSEAPSDDVVGHEVTHSVQQTGSENNLVQLLVQQSSQQSSGDTLQFAPATQVLTFISSGDAPVSGDSPKPQIVELQNYVNDITGEAGQLLGQISDNLESNGPTVTEIDALTQGLLNLNNQISDAIESLSPALFDEQTGELTLAIEAIEGDALAQNFAGYSVSNYLNYKDAMDEELVEGDQGFTLVPIFDPAGNLVSYRANTWTVTTQSGVFTPVISNIPEPGSLAMLAGAGLLAARRRR